MLRYIKGTEEYKRRFIPYSFPNYNIKVFNPNPTSSNPFVTKSERKTKFNV